MILEGTILRGRRFEPMEGRIRISDGRIIDVVSDSVESEAIILPAFVNAHTHVGDSIAKETGADLTLEELVAPPDGLKHRLLRETDRETLVAGMRESLRFMHRTGTGAFVDFREGGVSGVQALREASVGLDIGAVILGRDELEVLEVADGFGASGAADADFERQRRATAKAGKRFGIHAGEVGSGDINPALDLDPDFVVHMVAAEMVHLERIADRETPVVVCPRSNLATGVGCPPVKELVERTTVALGTDNVMLASPSMFREMSLLEAISELDAQTILGMATHAGATVAGLEGGVIAEDVPARVLVLDGASDNLARVQDPVRGVVRRACASDVKEVIC